MFTAHLNNNPLSKFILIEDCIKQPSKSFLRVLIDSHTKYGKILYFTFEGVYKIIPNVTTTYDCVSNCNGWLASHRTDFMQQVKAITTDSSVIVIDSLVHAVMQHTFRKIYTTIKELMDNKNILRVIAVFHVDLENSTLRYFQHLATMQLILQPEERISYVYKKGRKVIAQTESYRIENGILKCEQIKPVTAKVLLQNLNPEELSTFRISLNDNEKELRNQVVLPYLPKENDKGEGQIFYEFDQVDDWDEEDPDDDLDI
ncbi:hypothetical protein RN001_016347 [Aquatica leii]|uniref:Elongator complex protein 5 n=1 Tax=Aquatica leii TaxID=1421715 RepID=A0AAN7QBF5_9COLE|nr:hypothetical protein RN001_016347 [Aquatica leii]